MSLNEAQKKAVSHKEGPCLVLAGPGSGKTLTIAKRIEYLITEYKVMPEEILVITFTKYAAKEMKERFLRMMGKAGFPVTFGTFHGIYYGILKWAYGFGQESLLSEEEKKRMLGELIRPAGWEAMPEGEEEKEFLAGLIEAVGNVKNNGCDIEAYESCRYDSSRFRKLYLLYEEEKKRRRKIDFEDMLVLCRDLFRNRPDILKKWQKKFRYILVDEFQDINQVQYDVIRMLAAPEDNLFVVGDDDQSVYGFRGARPGIMQAFEKDYPKTKRILLDVNYRSTSHIVNGASRVIGHNKCRYQKEVRTFLPPGEPVQVKEAENPLKESQYIVSKYREFVKEGIPPGQIAVLYRTASDARVLAETFTEYQIPFHMKEQIQHVYEHFICQDMESYLRLASGHYTRSDMLKVSNRPNRYIGRDSMEEEAVTFEDLKNFYSGRIWMQERISKFEEDMRRIETAAPFAAVEYIRKGIGYDEFLEEYAASRHLDREELFFILEDIQARAGEFHTAGAWLSHTEECRKAFRKSKKKQPQAAGISFITMHKAKGLEYEAVFIIQGNEGTVPHKKAHTDEEIEEERRLFYVAMTRAKKKLMISYVKEKGGKKKIPSRFVNELFLAF